MNRMITMTLGLTATPTSLYLDMDATTSGYPNAGLLFSANDSTFMNCNDCFQHMQQEAP